MIAHEIGRAYGFDYMDFNEDDRSIINREPFQVVSCEDGSYLLCKLVSRYFRRNNAKDARVNIVIQLKPYRSISQLFEDVMYMGESYFTVSEETVAEIERNISMMSTACAKQLQPRLRYSILRRFKKRPVYTVQTRGISLISEYEKKNNVKFSDFEDAVTCFSKNKEDLLNLEALIFPTSDDLLVWAFEFLVINRGKEFMRCACCGHYFVRDNYNKKYCGRACYQKMNNLNKHLGNDEINRMTKNINQAFLRKINSTRTYEYVNAGEEVGILKQAADEKFPQNEYTKVDFVEIKKIYALQCKEKTKQLKKSYRDYKANRISAEEFRRNSDLFLAWLIEIRADLKRFRIEKDL